MELGNVPFGNKNNVGELVLQNDRIEIYTCECKIHLLPPSNLRAIKQLEIPLEQIRHATYKPGGLLNVAHIEIFLKPESYDEVIEKMKGIAGIFNILVRKNNENKLLYPCRRVPKEVAQRFVEKILELKEHR